jgi:hypothetical protein
VKSLVESFTRPGKPDGGKPMHHNYKHGILLPYTFVEIFGRKKLSTKVDIPTFKPGFDPVAHIHQCENEWRRVGYQG